MSIKQSLIPLLKKPGLYKTFTAPPHIQKNFKQLTPGKSEALDHSLFMVFFPSVYGSEVIDKADIYEQQTGRLIAFRNKYVPFLDSLSPLKGMRILEIGCGTGSSTVAFAEQGAIIHAIDIDEPSIEVAKVRCEAYGVNATFTVCNAIEIKKLLAAREEFDAIMFFASLEHMTNEERIVSIRDTWSMLGAGKYWCIFNSPNRLWHFDHHTTELPYYMWLPDDLAFNYSKFCNRPIFKDLWLKSYDDHKTEFARWGRGVSYHELELAIKKYDQLNVIGNMHEFLRPRGWLRQISYRMSDEYRYKALLQKLGPPGLPAAFYESYLDLVIEKN